MDYGYEFEFNDKSIRNGFIRKVYSILMCQLVVTLAFMSIFFYVPAIKEYTHQNIWVFIVALILTFVCLITLACCPDVRRKSPLNFIFLGIFTVCESFLLGISASSYDADAVLIAVGITAALCFGLTLFAFQTKIDFTMCSGGLFVALLVLLIFGFLAAIIQNRILNLVYASIGALIFGLYLVLDTQLMIGGKHKYSISPEEYIFATLNLYLDIINLFMFILSIVGSARD